MTRAQIIAERLRRQKDIEGTVEHLRDLLHAFSLAALFTPRSTVAGRHLRRLANLYAEVLDRLCEVT
jgi:hypothetical protein